MTRPFVDTNILVRFIAGDLPELQASVAGMLEQVERGDLELQCPVTVIADAVYVLASKANYGLDRQEISDTLTAIIRLPHFHLESQEVVLAALPLFAQTNLDFGDAMLLAAMRLGDESHIYSYDHDFDHFPDIQRLEPNADGSALAA